MYQELLAALLGKEDKAMRISNTTVTPTAIRSGLNSALKLFNQQMELCDLPTVKGRVSVSELSTDGIITIKIVTAPQAKFTFTIVEED